MKLKIEAIDVQRGMYVTELDRPWLGTPFLLQGFQVRSREEIEQLSTLCRHIYVDAEKSKSDLAPQLLVLSARVNEQPPQALMNTTTFRSESPEKETFKQQLRESKKVYDDTRAYIDRALEEVRLGASIDTEKAKALVGHLIGKVVKNPSALLWLTHLKSRDEYTATHCVNVCILSLSFARCLGYSAEEMNTIGLGALLHDLGKMRIPLEVLNKPGRLSDEEFKLMKGHPVFGHSMLVNKKEIDNGVLDIVLYHHERPSGRGYPRGLRADEIHHYAKIVSIVDVYDAITSDRAYHDAITPHAALKNMYNWAPEQFDQALMEAFIQCMGIYPIGSIVRLNTSQVGVVVNMNEAQRLKPMVLLILDSNGQRYATPRLVNLASSMWKDMNNPYHIQQILEPGAYGIDVKQIIEDQSMV